VNLSSGAGLVLLVYGMGAGIYLERKGVPAELVKRARTALDNEARRTARLMTDEIHARHAELEAVKLLCRLTGFLW
jgi:hypothetical protein